ncbi:thioesterase family protein [bacterium]|nr:thioesterase family protein [bacterium]
MNLLLRLIWVLLTSSLGRRRDFMASSVVTLRVLPNDIDLNLHMTNARYFSVMDLGRVDLLVRSGLGGLMLRNRWQAILGASTIRFRRPLAPLQRYRLTSRVLCWDDRWIYLDQRIETMDGTVAATAVMQGAFLSKGAILPPADVLAALGESRESPQQPDFVAAWRPQYM